MPQTAQDNWVDVPPPSSDWADVKTQGPPKPPPGIGLPDPAQQAHDATVGSMGNAVKQQLATLDPQDRYLASLPEGPKRDEATARMGKGMSMALPETLMSVGAMGPVGAIAREGVIGAAKSLGSAALRAGVKSYAGSKALGYGGREIGGMFGPDAAKTGEQIGTGVGAVAGPFVSGESFARMPFGLGRLAATDEEIASSRAAQKLAQRNADTAAGLRKPATVKEPMKLGGTSTSPESVSTLPPAALPEIAKGAQGSMTSTGPVPATPLGTPEVTAKPIDPVAAAIKQGIAAKLPTRMPKVTPAPPSIADISPQANEPRFSGSEGRPATWTNETVNELAAKGNRDAISQAIRRGLQLPNNARYIMGDADYPRAVLNPRETTLFAPDGTPIRNAENPLAQNPSSKARIARGEMPPARVTPIDEPGSSSAPAPPPPWPTSTEQSIAASPQPIAATPKDTPAARIGAGVNKPPSDLTEMYAQGEEPEKIRLPRGVQEMQLDEQGNEIPSQKAPRVRQARTPVVPASEKFSPDVIEMAKHELAAAHGVWSELPAPGRFPYLTEGNTPGSVAIPHDLTASESWYGINSPRPSVESLHPWLKDMPEVTLSTLKAAMEKGKGASYERILSGAAEQIQREVESAKPILDEFGPELQRLAESIKDTDPEVSQAALALLQSKGVGWSKPELRQQIQEVLSDAQAADHFSKALDAFGEVPVSSAGVHEAPDVSDAAEGTTEETAQAPELDSSKNKIKGKT